MMGAERGEPDYVTVMGIWEKQQAQRKLLISYLQLQGTTGKSHKVKKKPESKAHKMANINKQALCVTNEEVIKLCWQSLYGQRKASKVTFICGVN